MKHASSDPGSTSLRQGTGRMAVVLALALIVNVMLLAAPLVFGTRGDQAVAASVATPSPAPVAKPPSAVTPLPVAKLPTKTPTKPPSTRSPQRPQETVVEWPVVETIIGDEGPGPAIVTLPHTGDLIARVESPAPREIPADADPLTPARAPELANDPFAELAPEYPWDLYPDPLSLPAPMPDFDPCLLEITNPLETNGPVHFVIAGEIHTLEPGETRQWAACSQRTVEFHRGDDYGEASYSVDRGTWHFQVSDAGWELIAAEHVSMATQP